LFSFFKSAPAPAPAAPKVVEAKPEPPKVQPMAGKREIPSEDKLVADPVSDVFNSFFGTPKAPAAKKEEPAPAPVTAPTPAPAAKKAQPFFSFAAPKPAPKKVEPAPTPAPAPAPAPAAKKAQPFFSFAAPKPAPKKVEPAPTPAPAPVAKKAQPFFSFAAPKPAPKKVEPAPAPAPAPAPVKPKNPFSFGTFSLGPPAPKKEVAPATTAKAAAVDTSIPVLRNFVQNRDGSLTGQVSGSKNFRNNEKITTSPVRRGVKKGMVVKTSSGSQYRLE